MLQRPSGVRVSGKNLDIGSTLRGQAEERVHDAVSKYFDGGFRSRVTVEKEGTGFRADCTVYLDTGAVMRVSGSAHDAYSSVSQIVERIGKQMRRDKRKRQAYSHGGAAQDALGAELRDEDSRDDKVRNGSLLEEELNDDDSEGFEISEGIAATELEPAQSVAGESAPRPIVAEKVDRLETINLQEAIDRMEKERLSSYVFRNRGTERINILHERADGSIGWIDVGERSA